MKMNDTIHTNVLNETYKDTYNTNNDTNDTYTNIQDLNVSSTKRPFDF